MAIVKSIEHQALERESKHTEAACTFDVVTDSHGRKYLQLDTYGSASREMRGKKSQSIRLTPEAIQQLKVILKEYGFASSFRPAGRSHAVARA